MKGTLEVLTEILMKIQVFREIILHHSVHSPQYLEGSLCLHLQGQSGSSSKDDCLILLAPEDEGTTILWNVRTTDPTIQHHIPVDLGLQRHCCKNFKPNVFLYQYITIQFLSIIWLHNALMIYSHHRALKGYNCRDQIIPVSRSSVMLNQIKNEASCKASVSVRLIKKFLYSALNINWKSHFCS